MKCPIKTIKNISKLLKILLDLKGGCKMKLDLAVINGTAYVNGKFKSVDIGIKDEKFVMITADNRC